MRKQDVLDYFKSGAATARALGYTEGAISQWGAIIPELTARKLAEITNGDLPFDPAIYQRKRRQKAA